MQSANRYPRGLSWVDAAHYLGISPSKFDEMRKDRRVGPAHVIDGRKIWDVRDLDLAFEALPMESNEAAEEIGTVHVYNAAISLPAMPRRLPPGCVEDRDRHGNIRVYYRTKNRPKVRLRGTPWTPEVHKFEYDAAKGLETAADVGARGIRRPWHMALAML